MATSARTMTESTPLLLDENATSSATSSSSNRQPSSSLRSSRLVHPTRSPSFVPRGRAPSPRQRHQHYLSSSPPHASSTLSLTRSPHNIYPLCGSSSRYHPSHPLHHHARFSSASKLYSSPQTQTTSRSNYNYNYNYSQSHTTTNYNPNNNSSTKSSSQSSSSSNNKKLTQLLISLPYHLLCISNPYIPPLCGLLCCFPCIRTSEYGMLETFGKFDRVLEPGMHCMMWPMERVAGRVSVRLRQLDLRCESKSRDHVFIHVHISIQYQADTHHLFESFYSLTSPTQQITSHTLNTLRSTLPQMNLDDIFSSQDSIALELHRSLNGSMNKYGYIIHHALLTKVYPNEHVKASMNEMQASKRMKEAVPHKAEAVRIQRVKEAEGRAERAYLNGVGVARERREIVNGMRDVMEDVISISASCGLKERNGSSEFGGGGNDDDDGFGNASVVSTKGVMDLLLLTQYFDLITSLSSPTAKHKGGADDGAGGGAPSSLMVTHTPDTVLRVQEQVRTCFESITSNVVPVEKLVETS